MPGLVTDPYNPNPLLMIEEPSYRQGYSPSVTYVETVLYANASATTVIPGLWREKLPPEMLRVEQQECEAHTPGFWLFSNIVPYPPESILPPQRMYLRGRWYKPSIARFLSRGAARPGAPSGGYIYVQSNPVNKVDPSGLAEL